MKEISQLRELEQKKQVFVVFHPAMLSFPKRRSSMPACSLPSL